jgi:hypothetical protein
MRRDILAGCIGLIVSAYIVYIKRNKPVYKPIEYSPFIYKPDISEVNLSGVHSIQPSSPANPSKSNTYTLPEDADMGDTYTMDELMQLPLEGGGFIYDSVEESTIAPKTVYIKYIRFQCTEIRNSDKVEVGGFRFLHNSTPVPFSKIQTWNPHTGESSAYSGGTWSDSDQNTIVFCFSEPLEVNEYEIRTSAVSMDYDPLRWKLEGSMNGSFWTILDDRTKKETGIPLDRGYTIKYKIQ